ncbi:MAG: autotransporter-associated beta strand repeat-containing protein [Verrucomicrobia subdivision 3 bacterium]|nr:autotransporter-associated beta strand repeat-containing protein [Limisphaerales bacterium]
MKRSATTLALAVLATLASTGIAYADTHTWSGGAITPNWSTPANWAGDNPPYAGEPAPVYIIFPAGAARQVNYCNIANLVVNQIAFNAGGYRILSAAPGTAIALTNSLTSIISSATNNTLAVPLILSMPHHSFIVASNTDLHLSGALSGPGGFRKFGRGALYLEGTEDNTFTQPATVLGGTLHLNKSGSAFAFGGPLIIGDTNGPAYPGQAFDSAVQLHGDQQMSFNTDVTVNSDGVLRLYGHNLAVGSLTMTGSGKVEDGYTGNGTLTLLGKLSSPYIGNFGYHPHITCKLSLGGAERTFDINSTWFEIEGVISGGGGSAGLVKTGYGLLVLRGNNSYTGISTVQEGGLYVNGSQPASDIVVLTNGHLSGWGSVGKVNCQGGGFYPYLTDYKNLFSKDVTMDSASTFGVTIQAFQTPAAPSFLTVTGAVNLGNCEFYRVFYTNATFQPGIGTQFMLIQNDSNDPINGTFSGLPEGAVFKFGGRQWQITYKGGTGNDVLLTMLSLQLPLSTDLAVVNQVDKWVHVYGTGTPDVDYELHASTNFINWIKVDDAYNRNGALEAIDGSWWDGAPRCFYRFYQP